MRPHISVCIPVYQGAPTLAATLRSVLASENADFEVVIRDNGSTDGTSGVVAGFDDPRIRYIRSEGTLPLPANWRATVGQARGELIKVVCADDLISPDCLASQATLLRSPSSRAAATSSTVMATFSTATRACRVCWAATVSPRSPGRRFDSGSTRSENLPA